MQIRGKVAVAAAAAGLVALSAGVAEAAWLKSGSGAGTATAKSVGAASALNADVATSPGSVKLSWQAPTSSGTRTAITGYQLLRYTASTGTTGQTAVCSTALTSTATSCTDGSGTAGTTYYYTVAAVFTGTGGTAPGWVGPATSPRTSATPASAVATATKLVFTTAPSGVQTASSVASIGAYVVAEEDSSGNPVNATSDVSVTLSTTSAGTTGNTPFFSATQNGTASQSTTTVTITSGHSATSSFYYSDTKAGTPTLTAHSGSLTDATTSPTIKAAAAVLGFTGTTVAGNSVTCSPTVAIDTGNNRTVTSTQVQVLPNDVYGNAVTLPTSGSVTVDLTLNSAASTHFGTIANNPQTINLASSTTSTSASSMTRSDSSAATGGTLTASDRAGTYVSAVCALK